MEKNYPPARKKYPLDIIEKNIFPIGINPMSANT